MVYILLSFLYINSYLNIIDKIRTQGWKIVHWYKNNIFITGQKIYFLGDNIASHSNGSISLTDGNILHCKLPDSKVGGNRKLNVHQHINTSKYKAGIKRKPIRDEFKSKKSRQRVLNNKNKCFIGEHSIK